MNQQRKNKLLQQYFIENEVPLELQEFYIVVSRKDLTFNNGQPVPYEKGAQKNNVVILDKYKKALYEERQKEQNK